MSKSFFISKRLFAWFTVCLSSVYFISALYQLILFFISPEIRKYGISVLVFPLAFLLIGVGSIRLVVGRMLFKEHFDKSVFKFVFGLLCFFEIVLGFIYGLALVEELGLLGNIIVLLFIFYYVLSLPFFRNIKSVQ